MAKQRLEIERRWLLECLPGPEILRAPTTNYICYSSIYFYRDERGVENRIQRRVNHKGPFPNWSRDVMAEITFPIVTKKGHGMVRQETTKIAADQSDYDYYFYKRPKLPIIVMNLWEIPRPGGHKWEIKVPDSVSNPPKLGFDKPNGLILAELEFDSVEEAIAFSDFPDWMKIEKEVTDDPRYNVLGLALHGMPKPR